MKKLLILTGLLLGYILSFAQATDYKVIFDITSKDPADHKTIIRQINGIMKERPDAKLEVAVYGDALDMVLKDKSTISNDIMDLTKNNKVSVKVCGATMKRNNKEANQLVQGVDVVPDAIYEIISKQKEGWGYIKSAH
ncbi:hypothetical protein SAMN05518672_106216 [Chitinophaga sp. CF118]|uniref:DsrE family protein n=1 Tax=Chitinophaga sp. CF118 TaxID=1884367 RepID=UPI0008DEB969|nr:DsrE family protein [Chitinophaga sp. CF118]SFE46514.1 hypothetical protein SAMN05518672_106216 [Chitinophaga sp. CF118]